MAFQRIGRPEVELIRPITSYYLNIFRFLLTALAAVRHSSSRAARQCVRWLAGRSPRGFRFTLRTVLKSSEGEHRLTLSTANASSATGVHDSQSDLWMLIMKTQHVALALTDVNAALLFYSLARPRRNQSARPAQPKLERPNGATGFPEIVEQRLISSQNSPHVKLGASED